MCDKAVLITVATAIGTLPGCSGGSGTVTPIAARPNAVTSPTPFLTPRDGFPFVDTTAVGSGDRQSQRFCAELPATGFIRYGVTGTSADLITQLRHVLGANEVGVAWNPGNGRGGELIASVHLHNGATVQRTVRFFHPPYYNRRGQEVLLTTNSDRVLARAEPCNQ